jgi:hypothetical protein
MTQLMPRNDNQGKVSRMVFFCLADDYYVGSENISLGKKVERLKKKKKKKKAL